MKLIIGSWKATSNFPYISDTFPLLSSRLFFSLTSGLWWSRWAPGRNLWASWRDAYAGWQHSGPLLLGGWMTSFATTGESKKGWIWEIFTRKCFCAHWWKSVRRRRSSLWCGFLFSKCCDSNIQQMSALTKSVYLLFFPSLFIFFLSSKSGNVFLSF